MTKPVSEKELKRQSINNKIFKTILGRSLSTSQIHEITGIPKKVISNRMYVYKKKNIVNVEFGLVNGKKCRIYSCSEIPQRVNPNRQRKNDFLILADRYELKPTKSLFELCHNSATLWNLCNNIIKNRYFLSKYGNTDSNLNFKLYKPKELKKLVNSKPEFRQLNYQVGCFIIDDLLEHWSEFLKTVAIYAKHPKRYTGKPGFPKNKDEIKGQFKIRISGHHTTLRKTENRNNEYLLRYTHGIWYKCHSDFGYLHFPVKNFNIPPKKIRYREINNVMITPKKDYYLLQVTYKKSIIEGNWDKKRIVGIDLGVNWIAIASNIAGCNPSLINIKYIKSLNNYYNRRISKLRKNFDENNWKSIAKHNLVSSIMNLEFDSVSSNILTSDYNSILAKIKAKNGYEAKERKLIRKYQFLIDFLREIKNKTKSELLNERSKLKRKTFRFTKKMAIITRKRENKIRYLFHSITNFIIENCKSRDIGTIVFGYNEKWKQSVNLGRRNNQNFVYIPFLKIVKMLEYKGKLNGIEVIRQNESHTSKCSALDFEEICHHKTYLCQKKDGKGRITRGLFISENGYKIQSDINGALNIMRKCRPDCLDQYRQNQGVEKWKHFVGVVLRPSVIELTSTGFQ